MLFFKRLYPKARIVAFEPDPTAFALLKKNVEINELADVQLNNLALSSEDGEIAFYRSANKFGSLMMSTFVGRQPGEPTRVLAKRLSPFITDPIDLLKMDIEGAERLVLPELSASGKLSLIKQMHIEYHHHIVPSDDRLSETLKLLEDNGFGYQLKGERVDDRQHAKLAAGHKLIMQSPLPRSHSVVSHSADPRAASP